MHNKLVPPCSYQGGKQRLAKQIVDIILEQNDITDRMSTCGNNRVSGVSP